jgi:hypothetical protein
MTSWLVRFAAKCGVLAAAFVVASIAHSQGVSASKANDLENQFEHALIERDSKAVGALMADNASIIYATPSLSPSRNNSIGQYTTAAIWSKAEFLSQIDDGTAAGTNVVCLATTACRAELENFDDGNRQTTSYGASSVVTVPAQELIPRMVSCFGNCRVLGPHAEVYVTAVWTRTALGQRVVFFETALIKPGVDKYLRPENVLSPPLPDPK